MLNEDSGPNLAVTKAWSKLLMASSSSPSFFLSKTSRILMFLMFSSLCEVEVIEWWRKVVRNIDEGLRKKFHEGMKEIWGVEGWEKWEKPLGDRSWTVPRPVAGGKIEVFLWLLEERMKREEFGNFVMEARVDEWCYSPLKNGRKDEYIYIGENGWLEGWDLLRLI